MSARLAQILTTALLAAHLLLAPASHAAPDIVNGSPTQGWPTVARLVIEGGAPRVCSAVFIGCQTALTAAHCVCDGTGTGDACPGGDDQFVEAPENLYLYLQHGGLYFVRGISVPANYEFGVASDVAVLDLSDSLRGIAPSPINTRNRPSVPQSAQIVGFGSDFNMAGSGIKSEGVITTESCESSSTIPDDTHLCWTLRDPLGEPGSNSSTCFGDSGGPLFADLGAGLSVAGIHSGSFNSGVCAVGDLTFDSDVFVDRAWIAAEVGADLDSQRCGDGPQVGEPEVTSVNESGIDGAPAAHSVEVPAGTKLLRVGLNAENELLSGDFDLYLKQGAPPTTTDFDCRSVFFGNLEFCEITDPAAGTWHVLVAVSGVGTGDYQLTMTMLPENPAPPPLSPGDLLVADFVSDEIFWVEPDSGDRRVVSSALRGRGPRLRAPEDVVVESDGTMLVTNLGDLNLLRLDPVSGDRSLVSGCVDPECDSMLGLGPGLLGPRFVAREDASHLIVSDRAGLPTSAVALVRIDETNGDRAVVSGCVDDTCSSEIGAGPVMDRIFGIAIEASGSILASTSYALLRVDPISGDRSVVSGCTSPACSGEETAEGPSFGRPNDIAFDPDGDVYIADGDSTAVFRAIFHVEADTGLRTIVSGCEDALCGTLIGSGPNFGPGLIGLTVTPGGGAIFATDVDGRSVFRVDPSSGARSIASGCGDIDCSTFVGAGALFSQPVGLTLPEPASGLSLWTALCVLFALKRRSLKQPRRE